MNRYSERTGTGPQVTAGWQLSHLAPPSGLFGANGMQFGPDGRLYVVQAFGSQVSAINTGDGVCQTVSPVGGAIVAPDDIAFDSRGVMYVTEVMNGRVSARAADGQVRVIADNVPAANGLTAYQDRLFMDECRPGGRLMEVYPDGRAPRLIAADLPLPNALSVGPDGQLYFPEIAAGEIWRVPLTGGAPQRFLAGLAVPTAVKFDRRGLLTTTQAGSGEIIKVDVQSGVKTTVAKVRPGIDNFAIDADNRLFISHFVDGGVAEILSDGRERVLVSAGFLGPLGLAVAGDGTVYAADGLSVAAITREGKRSRPGMLLDEGFPGFVRGVAAGPGGSLYVTTSAGTVASYHPGTRAAQTLASGLHELLGLAQAADGAVVVAEAGEGRVLKISTTGEVIVLARGLDRPAGVAAAADGSCYVSEAGKGRVVKINGGVSAVLEGLSNPQGLALAGDQLFVLDVGSKELLTVSLATKQRQTLVANLPVGAPPGVTPKPLLGVPDLIPGPLSPFAGLAAGNDGTVYIAGDGEGSVLALQRAA
ncbi:MAG TPA: gluconolaconase [Candidatus Binatia bacterium]|nr:gluconolaconase [Candidatus Binatia bacterium]